MKRYFAALCIVVFCLCSTSGKSQEMVYKLREPLKKTNQRAPVLFILHGYGSNEEDLFDLAKTLDEHLSIFSLRAPILLAQGSYCWYNLARDQNNTLIYNYKEVTLAKKQIMTFIQSVCATMKLDSSQVFLLGFSQGAMMSYDLALAFPGKIKGVLALSGRLMEESKPKSNSPAALNTCFFIAHGTEDERIPATEAEKAVTYLKSKGVNDLEYKIYPMQHVLNGKEISDIRIWLSKHLKKPMQTGK
ncbi:MAG: prolyl oligopeptidase family serine peptidase [Bacteroidia bacterium]|jgi:phospholipase/carboxylesterase|nr:prolyl oligopeptidase family serine peptidase [Bacteroidia bacterium]